MDQNPQAPMPPVEPTTPAPQSPTEPTAPVPSPAAPNSALPPTPSSNKGLIIGLIVGGVILLLVVIGIVLAVVLGSKNTNTNVGNTEKQGSSNQQPADDSLRAANAETATSLSSFDAVCDNGSISNAADYKKPYKVAAFAKNSTLRSYSTVSLSYNADYAGKYGEHEKVNVVACLDEKAGSAIKSKTCDFKSAQEKITLDYYAVKYTLSLREAKTGKLIKDLGEINGPATTCPFFATYDKTDPKYYAKPDSDAVDAAIKAFVAE